MIEVIFWTIYFVGLTLSVYPIYFRLVLGKRKAKAYTTLDDIPYGMLPILATIFAACWPIVMPFAVSTMIHTRKLPDFADTKQKAIEYEKRQKHYEQIRDQAQREFDRSVQAAMWELDNL